MRPRRQAALTAERQIAQVLEWESLPESSKRVRDVAAQIDREFEREVHSKRVRFEDCDVDETMESEADALEEPTEEDMAFVEEDCVNDSDEEYSVDTG